MEISVVDTLLQQLDLDGYRSAPLLVALAELEHLRKERSACADVKRRNQLRLGASLSADSRDFGGPLLGHRGKVRCE
jgi:hypothetical protein